MSLHCINLFYTYTKTYNDNLSQSIYLQKLAVLPFLNVKSLVFLNNSCMTTFCRWDNGLKDKVSSIYFCRVTIPAFHAGNVKGVTTTAFTNLL